VDKSEILIVGDSLTSDIRGGNNMGILTCWYNPQGKEKDRDVQVDYEIRDLSEVLPIIEG
ncbi:MAG: HAD hydrolase-like protein, partial [Agathobacter sp.]|nr:HAD hydrolase-like protein [Agathobacter sp.]